MPFVFVNSSFIATGHFECAQTKAENSEKDSKGRQSTTLLFVPPNAHVSETRVNFNNHPEGLFFFGHTLLNVSLSF